MYVLFSSIIENKANPSIDFKFQLFPIRFSYHFYYLFKQTHHVQLFPPLRAVTQKCMTLKLRLRKQLMFSLERCLGNKTFVLRHRGECNKNFTCVRESWRKRKCNGFLLCRSEFDAGGVGIPFKIKSTKK